MKQQQRKGCHANDTWKWKHLLSASLLHKNYWLSSTKIQTWWKYVLCTIQDPIKVDMKFKIHTKEIQYQSKAQYELCCLNDWLESPFGKFLEDGCWLLWGNDVHDVWVTDGVVALASVVAADKNGDDGASTFWVLCTCVAFDTGRVGPCCATLSDATTFCNGVVQLESVH